MTKKLYLSDSDVRTQVHKIMRDMQEENWRPDYIVGITRGGAVPAVMLSHYMKLPMETLKVQLRDGGESESNCWMADDAFGYGTDMDGRSDPSLRRNILIVDDINDTGATLEWIRKDWQGSCLPANEDWGTVWHNNVRFAVLVHNAASPATVDYAGHEINKAEDDAWVVFPWENWWSA
jgi:xanthine phosphoribosyltransferase